MKIYTPEVKILVRLQISRQGEKSKYLSFIDTTLENAQNEIMDLIKLKLKDDIDPFKIQKRTSLAFRDAVGKDNLKSSSKSFIGLSVEETYEEIINHFKKNDIDEYIENNGESLIVEIKKEYIIELYDFAYKQSLITGELEALKEIDRKINSY